MSAIQLLELLGADASKRNAAKKLFNENTQDVDKILPVNNKLWCLMVPEKDDEDEEPKEDPDSNKIAVH